jgi:hypothetical protein
MLHPQRRTPRRNEALEVIKTIRESGAKIILSTAHDPKENQDYSLHGIASSPQTQPSKLQHSPKAIPGSSRKDGNWAS